MIINGLPGLHKSLTVLAMLAVMMAYNPANAADLKGPKSYLAASMGHFNVFDGEDNAADFRIEYHANTNLIFGIKPWFGAEATTDATLWLGGGVERDFFMTSSLFLTPSIGLGYYAKGSSDLDLDYPLQFRTQLMLGYETESTHRYGIALRHTSNASLGDDNPGTEVLSLYYMMPLN